MKTSGRIGLGISAAAIVIGCIISPSPYVPTDGGFVPKGSFVAATNAPSTVKEILFWGQSNAGGQDDYANITNANGYVDPLAAVQLSQYVTSNFTDPISFQIAGTRAATAPRFPAGQVNFGPELSMARHLNRVQPGVWTVAKWGIYASGLEQHWLPSSTYPTSPANGPNLFTQAMNDASAQASAQHATVSALVWIQGENDAQNTTYASDYQANLTTFINTVRARYPNLPVVIARISSAQTMPFTSTIAAAENTVCGSIGHCTIVNTDDLTPLITVYHYNANNLVTLGDRIATAVLGQLAITDAYPTVAWTTNGDGIGFPQNATEWTAVIAATNLTLSASNQITNGGPFRATDFTVASGNATDLIGSVPLVASGTGATYQTAVPGFSRTGISWADAATAKYSTTDTSLPDLSTTSALTLTYARQNTWPGTFRNVATLGVTTQFKISTKSTGFWDIFHGTSNNTIGTAKPVAAVRPLIIQHNKTATTASFFSNQETFTVTWDPTVTGKGLAIGSIGNGGTNSVTMYEASFKGAAAELTPTQIRALLKTLGWIVQW